MKSREDTVGIKAESRPNKWPPQWQRELWKWRGKDGPILWELNEHQKKDTEAMQPQSEKAFPL